MTRFPSKIVGLAASFAMTMAALGADEATQKVDAGGMTFQAPSAWKASKPTSTMRKAQLAIPPVKGDSEPAELVVFAFGSGAGTVAANVDRWRGQFKDKDGNTPEATTEKVKGKNVEVTRVEVAGEYRDQFAKNKSARPNHRLLGAIAESKAGTAYFLKLVGPDKTVSAVKADFAKMLGTITVE